jgi:hypothetical protein
MGGKLDKRGYNNNKRDGFIYEMEFFTRALRNDLEVFLPAGDYLPQDCIVQNSEGKVFKVQVKGTRTASNEGPRRKFPRYRLSTGSGQKGKSVISPKEVDVVACYLAPMDIFYLLPVKVLKGVTTWIYAGDPKTKSRLEKYRENWSIFDN